MKLFNFEAEKAIIGSLIIDNGLIKKTQALLKSEYFHNTELRRLYDEIIKLFDLHGVVDIATLNNFEISFIVDICDSIVTTTNINHYIKIVSDLAVRREIYKSSDQIKEICLNENIEDILTIKGEALSVLNGINLPESKKSKRTMMHSVSDALTKLENMYLGGESAYYKWGLDWIQDKTGGMKSAYTILAARPSAGKTSLALQLGVSIAKQGAKVAIFSLETAEDTLVNTIICNNGNIDNKYMRKPSLLESKPDIWVKIVQTASNIAELPIIIYDNIFNVEELLLKCQELISTQGLDLVILDYIQLMETNKKTMNQNERVSYISRQLKKLQQSNGLHMLVLSQFSRESEKKKEPSLSDLRDSGSLEQDANNVWFLHVDSDFQYMEGHPIEVYLMIAKQKDGVRNIKKKLKFYGNSQKFYEN
jgi:replicative DNA helicase